MECDDIYNQLAEYLEKRGRFEIKSNEIALENEARDIFVPFLRSLPDNHQRRLVHFLGKIATGSTSKFQDERGQAFDILMQMALPWPIDCRGLLMVVKDDFMREFSKEENLVSWSNWDEENASIGWDGGPSYALSLYFVLLAVATDDELALPVKRLLSEARNRQFTNTLRLQGPLHEGIRLCSEKQLTREEFQRHYAAVRRKDLRDWAKKHLPSKDEAGAQGSG